MLVASQWRAGVQEPVAQAQRHNRNSFGRHAPQRLGYPLLRTQPYHQLIAIAQRVPLAFEAQGQSWAQTHSSQEERQLRTVAGLGEQNRDHDLPLFCVRHVHQRRPAGAKLMQDLGVLMFIPPMQVIGLDTYLLES